MKAINHRCFKLEENPLEVLKTGITVKDFYFKKILSYTILWQAVNSLCEHEREAISIIKILAYGETLAQQYWATLFNIGN